MIAPKESITISADLVGKRLDVALAVFLPEWSLRARRRLVARGGVLLNGLPGVAAQNLKNGDKVQITLGETPATRGARFLALKGDFIFFYKPAGIHTAALAGASAPSLEASLRELLAPHAVHATPTLLQRLDFGTSGIICAARRENAINDFRCAERAAMCRKYYLALLTGDLRSSVVADQPLATARRRKTAVLTGRAPALGRTLFQPLATGIDPEAIGGTVGKSPLTLAVCHILKGQRHQIRAHAAAIGQPLYGDCLYGEGNDGNFFLEHFLLELPGYSLFYLGANSLARQFIWAREALWNWLKTRNGARP